MRRQMYPFPARRFLIDFRATSRGGRRTARCSSSEWTPSPRASLIAAAGEPHPLGKKRDRVPFALAVRLDDTPSEEAYIPHMFGRAVPQSDLRETTLAIFALLFSQGLHAQVRAGGAVQQLPRRLKRCLPYATLADEIAETRAEEEAKQPPRAIVIDAVRFQRPSALPARLRKLLRESIKTASAKDNPHWLSELDAIRIVGFLEDRGYFDAVAHSTAQTLSESALTKHVALVVSVDTGWQYRVGRIQFRSARPGVPLVFSNERLRHDVPLRKDELISTSILRKNFYNLMHVYGAEGYIDFTPTPQFRMDDATRRIDITLELDEGKQYREHEIACLGHDAAVEKLIRSQLRIGEPFDGFFFRRFYATHKSILPADPSPEDVTLRRNPTRGLVNVVVDLRTCPSDSKD